MSKFNALITMLVLGSSSVALADTSFSFSGSAQASWGTPTVRDHRTSPTPVYQPTYQPAYHSGATLTRGSWMSLAAPMSGNANLRLTSQAVLNQIRIQSAQGASYISTVNVRFADGSRQTLNLNKWVDSRNPMLQFSLNRTGRVDRIQINGSAQGRRASYQVFGYGTQVAETPMPPVYQPPVHQPRMTILATALNFYGTTGRKQLTVNAGQFSTIRLKGLSGMTHINRVEIRFSNGQGQTLDAIGANLRTGQILDIPLDGAGANTVTAVEVFTNEGYTPVRTLDGEISVAAF